MVKCTDCKKEMQKATTCDKNAIVVNGEVYLRNTEWFGSGNRCHDCGIVNKKGNIHHFGCDMERCPRCGRQLISCNCNKGRRLVVKPFKRVK